MGNKDHTSHLVLDGGPGPHTASERGNGEQRPAEIRFRFSTKNNEFAWLQLFSISAETAFCIFVYFLFPLKSEQQIRKQDAKLRAVTVDEFKASGH